VLFALWLLGSSTDGALQEFGWVFYVASTSDQFQEISTRRLGSVDILPGPSAKTKTSRLELRVKASNANTA
jgi:hypothetical protein